MGEGLGDYIDLQEITYSMNETSSLLATLNCRI